MRASKLQLPPLPYDAPVEPPPAEPTPELIEAIRRLLGAPPMRSAEPRPSLPRSDEEIALVLQPDDL